MLVSANRFLAFLGWGDCQVKALRVQRQLFRENRRELTRGEFGRLIAAARAAGAGTAALADGDHLLHGHPGKRGEVYHRGGPAVRQGGDRPEGQDPHHPAPRQAVPEAAEVLQKKKSRLRRGVPHQKRFQPVPQADLGGDEVPCAGWREWRPPRCSPTTCGTCSPGPFSRPAGTWPSWRTCWGTALWRPPASTSSPPGRNTPAPWSSCGWCRRGQNNDIVLSSRAVCKKSIPKTPVLARPFPGKNKKSARIQPIEHIFLSLGFFLALFFILTLSFFNRCGKM